MARILGNFQPREVLREGQGTDLAQSRLQGDSAGSPRQLSQDEANVSESLAQIQLSPTVMEQVLAERQSGASFKIAMAGKVAQELIGNLQIAGISLDDLAGLLGRLQDVAINGCANLADSFDREAVVNEYENIRQEVEHHIQQTGLSGILKELPPVNPLIPMADASAKMVFEVGQFLFHTFGKGLSAGKLGIEAPDFSSRQKSLQTAENVREAVDRVASFREQVQSNQERLGELFRTTSGETREAQAIPEEATNPRSWNAQIEKVRKSIGENLLNVADVHPLPIASLTELL